MRANMRTAVLAVEYDFTQDDRTGAQRGTRHQVCPDWLKVLLSPARSRGICCRPPDAFHRGLFATCIRWVVGRWQQLHEGCERGGSRCTHGI